jgi:hypothetical protein
MNFPTHIAKMWVIVDVVVIAVVKDIEVCDDAPSGLPIPLHPGAERYDRITGVLK